ncbi:hypothetical protein D3C72_1241800 [compost metagenome]
MLDQLEAADGPAELNPVAGVFYRCLIGRLGNTQRRERHHAAADVEVFLGQRETLALGADQVGRGDLHVFEQQLAQRAAQHAHLVDGAGRETRHGALEQQTGHAAFAALTLGLHEHHSQLANRAQADVELAAIDAPTAGGFDGAGFDVGGVRADVRFAEREAGDRLARQDARQVLFLEIGRAAVAQHRGREIAGADDAAQRRPDARQLGDQHAVGRHRQAVAAVLFLQHAAQEAEVAHRADHFLRHHAGFGLVAVDDGGDFGRQVATQRIAQFDLGGVQ